MTFVNLSLLAGTALVALPIVLHLIMRQKPKRLEFPALRFIQKQHDANQRRLRLRHLLLLLLRAAAIALLACGLARPSVNFSGSLGSQEAPVAAAMVFDAAPRMEYRHRNQSRLEVAGELGLWLLRQLPRQSEIAVLDTRFGSGVFQVDAAAARQRIERLVSVPNSQPLSGAVEEALRLLGESRLARKELYIFSDLSRGAWPADSAAPLQNRMAKVPGLGIYVIDVGVQEPGNYALDELRLSGQLLSNRSPLRIETELSRVGPPGKRTVELHLLDDEQKGQRRREESYDLESGGSQRVDFQIESLEVGTHQGFLRIVGQDGLACDDTRYFTVAVKPAWRVLIVAPKPTGQYDFFLAQALASTESRRRGDAQFECRTIPQDELLEHDPASYAAVCLVDPKPMAPAVWKKLADSAADGRGVAIFLGRNAQPVDSFNAPVAQQVLPGKLLRQARAPDGVFLAPRDYQHPVLSEFRTIAGAIPWNASPVFRYWELQELHAGVGVVLPLTDGRPVLLERPLGDGRVLTMTTPISDMRDEKTWNLLPIGLGGGQGWPFVILANQILSYLVGSSDQRLNYFAGQTAVLRLDAEEPRSTYLLRAPGELTFPLSADLKRHLLVVTATDQVGNYRVQAGGSIDRGFSVNLAPEQTQLERVAEDELAEVFGPFDYRVARTRQEIERDVNRGRVGRELFPALILLVALVLGLEHLVANRFYRE